MEQILPWQNMTAVIEPFYPKAGNGRRPYPLETMLRIHCMQHWYNLSDGAMEDALYEIASSACLPDYPWIAPCRIAPPS